MNEIRPTIGIEFDDKYIDTKNKLIDFTSTLNKLTEVQKQQLVIEFLKSVGMAVYEIYE